MHVLLLLAFLIPGGEDFDTRLAQAVDLLQAGDQTRAGEILDPLVQDVADRLAADADDHGALLHAGKLYFYIGWLDKAKTHLTRLIELNARSGEACYYLGQLAMLQGDGAAWMTWAEKAAALSPEKGAYALSLARAYRDADHTESAVTAYRAVLALEPDNFGALVGLGGLVGADGGWDEAATLYGRAVKADPEDVNAWYNLGQMNQNLKRHEAALAAFDRVWALTPEDGGVLAKIIQENQALGRTAARDEAREALLGLYQTVGRAKGWQDTFCREQFSTDTWNALAYESARPEGDHYDLYRFRVWAKGERLVGFEVALSYSGMVAQVAKEQGLPSAPWFVERVDSGARTTLAALETQPDYETFRALVVRYLDDQPKPTKP